MKTRNLAIHDLAHVTRIESDSQRPRHRRDLYQGSERVFSTRQGGSARVLYLRKFAPLAAIEIESLFPRTFEQSRTGRPPLLRPPADRCKALFPFDINVWYGTPAQAAAVDDFADDNYDHSGLGFIGGTCLQPHTEMHPIEAASMSTFGDAPQWGSYMEGFHA